MTTNMSLHRVIAEIKSLESKLGTINSTPFVYVHTGETDTENTKKYEAASQAAYDKIQSQVSNLAALKAARNKANSVVTVSVAGRNMTIDEALAQKAAIPFKQQLISTLQSQFNQAEKNAANAQAQIEQKISQQVATMFTGTRKATEEELNIIRGSFERTGKATLIHSLGLKEQVEKLKKEVEDFTTEVDFVLSEANATNKVDVQLN